MREVCLVNSIIMKLRRTGLCQEQMEDYMIQILTMMEMEKLNAYEYSVMDDVVFGHEDTDTSEAYELEDDLSLAGLDATDLEYMDADERREALEDVGLDPDDYDFD